MVLLILAALVALGTSNSSQNTSQNTASMKQKVPSSQDKVVTDIKRKIEREEIVLEEMMIKRDDLEQKIQRLKFEITHDFETENKNQSESRRTEISLRQANLKIEEKQEVVEQLKKELGEIVK